MVISYTNLATAAAKKKDEEKAAKAAASKKKDKEDVAKAAAAKKKEEAPLPPSISQFKGHPLYVLQRHLLKFEAIFPADAPTLGFIKREPVYARECVKILQVLKHFVKRGN